MTLRLYFFVFEMSLMLCVVILGMNLMLLSIILEMKVTLCFLVFFRSPVGASLRVWSAGCLPAPGPPPHPPRECPLWNWSPAGSEAPASVTVGKAGHRDPVPPGVVVTPPPPALRPSSSPFPNLDPSPSWLQLPSEARILSDLHGRASRPTWGLK